MLLPHFPTNAPLQPTCYFLYFPSLEILISHSGLWSSPCTTHVLYIICVAFSAAATIFTQDFWEEEKGFLSSIVRCYVCTEPKKNECVPPSLSLYNARGKTSSGSDWKIFLKIKFSLTLCKAHIRLN